VHYALCIAGFPVRVAVIPGDGIGKEVISEAVRAIRRVGEVFGRTFEIDELPWGAGYFLATGIGVPADGYAMLRDEFDAVLVGAVGDPRVPDNRHAREILLGIRFELDLYVNYRPIVLFDARLCPLKDRTPAEIDMAIFRENTEGLYVGVGGRVRADTEDEIAIQEEVNTWKGVHRIVRYAFEWARAHGRRRVCMTDKSNAMAQGHALWQRVFREAAPAFPELQALHQYIDALALQMVRDPGQLDVIVTNNLFGDIITDLGAALQGGLGMAASANVHPGRTSMFEPVHGSAPALAGRNVANPMGAILSAGLMFGHLGLDREAAALERAVRRVVAEGIGTPDIGGAQGTREVGKAVVEAITF
jgi:3-isopropylmalate dehydrogenase